MNSMEVAMSLYQSLMDEEKPRVMERWHASSLTQCPRAQFFARKGVERTSSPTGAKVLRWRAGHLIEEAIRPELVKLMPNLTSNVRMDSDDLDLTGEYDNYDPDTKTLWEIKSVSGHAVKYKKVADDRHHLRDEGPYLHHVWQQHAYVLLMQERGIEVERIGFLYITLDGLIVPYIIRVDSDILNEVAGRIAGLNRFWSEDVMPPCICGDTEHKFFKTNMQYCDYNGETECCSEELLHGK